MSACVLPACISVQHMSGKGTGSPRTGVTASCEQLYGCQELNPGPLQEQSVPLTTKAIPPGPCLSICKSSESHNCAATLCPPRNTRLHKTEGLSMTFYYLFHPCLLDALQHHPTLCVRDPGCPKSHIRVADAALALLQLEFH